MAALTPEVPELFERANFAPLATLRPGGAPRSAAIWAGVEGDQVVCFEVHEVRATRPSFEHRLSAA
jgi:hypothetical protein